MKDLSKIISKACIYTVIMSFLFYIFAVLNSFSNTSLPASKYLIIFIFALIIATTNFYAEKFKLKVFWKELIRFIIIFSAFLIIFISSQSAGQRNVFIMVVLFIFFYFTIILLSKLVKVGIKNITSKK